MLIVLKRNIRLLILISKWSYYRSISVLPLHSSMFEKLAYNQLYTYLEENCFLSANPSGFRALHSTANRLLKTFGDWYDAMDNGEIAGLVIVDLKKAFDTVDHSILCQKLEHYNAKIVKYLGLNHTLVTGGNFEGIVR